MQRVDPSNSFGSFSGFSIRSRESSLEPSQWQILMKKYSADSRVKDRCFNPEPLPCERRKLQLPTGSKYEGNWTCLGMTGYGKYTFPNGTIYKGEFEEGMFHGCGELLYPNGVTLHGRWKKGVLHSKTLHFADLSNYDCVKQGSHGETDRRFQIEQLRSMDQWQGLKPGGNSFMTAEQPSKVIPHGQYDAGLGFYDPKTNSLFSYKHPENMIGKANPLEAKWIVDNCRHMPEKPVGPAPYLYKEWWDCYDRSNDGRASMTSGCVSERMSAGSKTGYSHRVIKFDPTALQGDEEGIST